VTPTRAGSEPPYVVIASDLREKIADGQYEPGEKLPTTRQLAQDYGAAAMTIQNAMRLLRDEGLIVTQQGRGTFVSTNPETGPEGERRSREYTEIMASLSEVVAELGRLDGRLRELEQNIASLQQAR
jgi:DNA-binding GntR family transcriptional regulator